jgi:chromosome segregation ATPase
MACSFGLEKVTFSTPILEKDLNNGDIHKEIKKISEKTQKIFNEVFEKLNTKNNLTQISKVLEENNESLTLILRSIKKVNYSADSLCDINKTSEDDLGDMIEKVKKCQSLMGSIQQCLEFSKTTQEINNLRQEVLSLESRKQELTNKLTEEKTKPTKECCSLMHLRQQRSENPQINKAINNLRGDVLSLENRNQELNEMLSEQMNIKEKIQTERHVAFNQKKSKNGNTKTKGNAKVIDLNKSLTEVNNSISKIEKSIKDNNITISINKRNLEMLQKTLE